MQSEQPARKRGRWDQGQNQVADGLVNQQQIVPNQAPASIPQSSGSKSSLVLERAKKAIEQAKKLKEDREKQKAVQIQQAPQQSQQRLSLQQIQEQQQQSLISAQQSQQDSLQQLQYSSLQQQQAQQQQDNQQQQDEKSNQFFDPRLGNRQLNKLNRRRKGALQFIEPGQLQKQAKFQRLKDRYGDMYERHLEELDDDYEEKQLEKERIKQQQGEQELPSYIQEIQQNIGEVPTLEWWDKLIINQNALRQIQNAIQPAIPQYNDQQLQLNQNDQQGDLEAMQVQDQNQDILVREQNSTNPNLQNNNQLDDNEEQVQTITKGDDYQITSDMIRRNKITHLVEHPIPIPPTIEEPPPPPQPLKLTQREQKKLKTQRRLERQKEKQDLIRKGLLEPPQPKVKISNLFRVLGAQSAADPTAIESEVRKQQDEREQAHKDRNLIRQKSQMEKKEKKMQKLFDSQIIDYFVCLYRIDGYLHPSNRFKIEQNALQNQLTGTCIEHGNITLVVVEGGPKSIKRYQKLMLRRIDWGLPPNEEINEDDFEYGGKCYQQHSSKFSDSQQSFTSDEIMWWTNYFKLNIYNFIVKKVWAGSVKEPQFQDFQMHKIEHESDVTYKLSLNGVENYFDIVKNFDPEVPFQTPF